MEVDQRLQRSFAIFFSDVHKSEKNRQDDSTEGLRGEGQGEECWAIALIDCSPMRANGRGKTAEDEAKKFDGEVRDHLRDMTPR